MIAIFSALATWSIERTSNRRKILCFHGIMASIAVSRLTAPDRRTLVGSPVCFDPKSAISPDELHHCAPMFAMPACEHLSQWRNIFGMGILEQFVHCHRQLLHDLR